MRFLLFWPGWRNLEKNLHPSKTIEYMNTPTLLGIIVVCTIAAYLIARVLYLKSLKSQFPEKKDQTVLSVFGQINLLEDVLDTNIVWFLSLKSAVEDFRQKKTASVCRVMFSGFVSEKRLVLAGTHPIAFKDLYQSLWRQNLILAKYLRGRLITELNLFLETKEWEHALSLIQDGYDKEQYPIQSLEYTLKLVDTLLFVVEENTVLEQARRIAIRKYNDALLVDCFRSSTGRMLHLCAPVKLVNLYQKLLDAPDGYRSALHRDIQMLQNREDKLDEYPVSMFEIHKFVYAILHIEDTQVFV
jgi:hypothetical protein